MGAVGRVGTGLHGSRARLRVLHSGAWLAVGTRFRPPLLYSLRSGQRHEAAGPRDWVDWDLVEVEGTPQLLVADGTGTIRRLTLDGAEVGEPTVVADAACLAVDTPVDPHLLAVGTASGDLHLWRWQPAFDHLGSTPASFADLQAVSVVADGRSAHLAATGSYDSMVHYWIFAAGAWAGGPIAFASNPSAAAQVCVDGDRALVVCSNEGALEWWDATKRRPLARSRTQRQRRNLAVTSLGGTGFGQLQPDPGSVLVLSDDGRVALLDGRNSPRSFQLDCGPLARAVIAVSRDGDGADSLIVAAVEEDGGDNEWALWQVPAKELYHIHERYDCPRAVRPPRGPLDCGRPSLRRSAARRLQRPTGAGGRVRRPAPGPRPDPDRQPAPEAGRRRLPLRPLLQGGDALRSRSVRPARERREEPQVRDLVAQRAGRGPPTCHRRSLLLASR